MRNEGGGFSQSAKLLAFHNWVSEILRNGKWVGEDEEKEERNEKLVVTLFHRQRVLVVVVAVVVDVLCDEPMFGGGVRWLRSSERFKFLATSFSTNARTRYSFCTSTRNSNNSNNDNKNIIVDERYRMLENLDMMTAAKILFTDPPKKKKFGFDFHLVQFFFACLPSLAVYLVAQYAHYEKRKLEVDMANRRKLKEEEEAKEKEKEMELNPQEENEEKSDPQLSELKVRLEKLEEAVKEIVVETKKQSSSNVAKNQVTDDEKKHLNSSAPKDPSPTDSASSKADDEDHFGKHNSPKSKPELREDNKGSVATPNPSLQDPKGQNKSGGAS
ncbi:unnamed protein product [Sphenostylis stenocarpa]|uniref:Uncharacterized protein n=1 Tax=Sphenostylis stenocarpa TaxID=92480 RepID=A0AA86SFL9_9FABA|nr:unnamed protein product [Sphenostylis stenocarpa]